MKLSIIAERKAKTIYRYLNPAVDKSTEDESTEDESTDNTLPLYREIENSDISDTSIKDGGRWTASGGRSGNPKSDRLMGYRTPPMY